MVSGIKSIFNNLVSAIEKLSLEKKLIISNILMLAIPFVVLGMILIQSIKANAEADSLSRCREAVRKAEINIKRNIEICSNAIQMIINNKTFLSFISTEQDYETEELLRFKDGALNNIQSILNINPDIYSIRFYSNNPLIFEMWGIIYNEQRILGEEWRTDVLSMNGRYLWRLNHSYVSFETLSTRKLPEGVVSLCVDISYPDYRHQGILEVNMASDIFFGDIYDKNTYSDSFMCLAKKGSEMVFNASNPFLTEHDIDIWHLQNQLLDKPEKDGDYSIVYKGRKLIVAYTSIDIIDSCLYSISTVDTLMKRLDRIRNYILLGIAAGIFILSVVTYMITSILMKKLKTVIESMRKVQDGDLNADIPVYGGDEMGELAYHYRKMMSKIKKLVNVLVQKQAAVKEAEIKALQSQINKHFIYNVLESINMLAEAHHEFKISEIVTSLGRLMRYSMSWDRQYVTLGEEFENVKDYISLVNARYGNVIQLSCDIDETLLRQEVLKMLLQPIVENAVIHGFEEKGRKGGVKITAHKTHDIILINITDNGTGMTGDNLEKLKNDIEPDFAGESYHGGKGGIGLKNVNTRIKLFYGKEYGIEVDSVENSYTSITIKLPYNSIWEESISEYADLGC